MTRSKSPRPRKSKTDGFKSKKQGAFSSLLAGFNYVLSGKWAQGLAGIDRAFSKRGKKIGKKLVPKFIQNAMEALSARVKSAEKKVQATGKSISKSVAKSAVGEGASKLAKKGKDFEKKAGKFLLQSLVELLQSVVPKPIQDAFKAFGKAFWRVFGVFFVFVGRWFKTRTYWHLIGGIPAFLLALPLAYCMIRLPFYGNAAKAKHYRAAANVALENEDYDTANLYFRKLQQLGAMNERAEFLAAINAYSSGDEAKGLEQLQQLAPLDNPGFPPAHIWLANYYLGGESGVEQEAAQELARQHLDRALERDPGNLAARSVRARFLHKAGRYDDALSELRRIVNQIPGQGLNLAALYASQGRWAAAKSEVEKVIAIFDDKVARGDDLEPPEYLTWSNAYYILGQQDQAMEILESGLGEHPGNEAIGDRLYQHCLRKLSLLSSQGAGHTEQVRLAHRAWQVKPKAQDPVILLAELAQAEHEAREDALAKLDQIVQSGIEHKNLYAIIGTAAAEKQDYPRAVEFLRLACKSNTEDAQAANNLAWVLLQLGDRSSITEGVELASRAVTLAPQRPDYRETRGQLLVEMGQFNEAIADLEFALNGLGDSPEIHAALARAYDGVGNSELAAAHRVRSN